MSRAAGLLVLVACADPGQEPVADHAVDALGVEALEAHTRALTDLGSRQVATASEVAARDVVFERLVGSGLAVVAEPFTFDAWLPGEATLTVGGDVLAVEAFSPTPPTHLVGTLASPDGAFDGAIPVFSSLEASRAEQYMSAALGGASAFVRVTDELDFDGGPLVEVGHTLEGADLPGVAVDQATGDLLRAAIGAPVTLDVSPIEVPGHTSENVVARLPGRGSGTVYVVAHYDSWHPSESAFDNAIGVGALLAFADRLGAGDLRPEAEIVLIATSGEEQGLQGAIAWVEDHADEVGPGDAVITLDVLWSGEGRFLAQATDAGLRALAMDAADREGLEVVEGAEPGLGSDHFPFVMEGASAVWCGRWPDRHYHTRHDTLDWIDLGDAAAAMRSQWRVLADLAGFDPGI